MKSLGNIFLKRTILGCIIVLQVILCNLQPSFGQNRIVIPRINDPIQLDGVIDEKAWANIDALPMIMHSPNYGDPPT